MRIDARYGVMQGDERAQSGLTFAPEAGTHACATSSTKTSPKRRFSPAAVKRSTTAAQRSAYFMNGLPTETDADIEGHRRAAQRIVDAFYETKRNGKGLST